MSSSNVATGKTFVPTNTGIVDIPCCGGGHFVKIPLFSQPIF